MASRPPPPRPVVPFTGPGGGGALPPCAYVPGATLCCHQARPACGFRRAAAPLRPSAIIPLGVSTRRHLPCLLPQLEPPPPTGTLPLPSTYPLALLASTTMAAADGTSGHYVGVVTPTQTMFHDVSAGAVAPKVGHYLVMMELRDVLVLGSFATQVAALCWLTNSLTKMAFINSSPSENAASAAAPVPGWLAVFNASECGVFDVCHDGVERALAMACTVMVGVSVVRRCPTARGGLEWLAGGNPNDIYDIMVADAPPPSRSLTSPLRQGGEMGAVPAKMLAIAASPVVEGGGGRHCGPPRASGAPEWIDATVWATSPSCSPAKKVHQGALGNVLKPTAPHVQLTKEPLFSTLPFELEAAGGKGTLRDWRSATPLFKNLKRPGRGDHAEGGHEWADEAWEGVPDDHCSCEVVRYCSDERPATKKRKPVDQRGDRGDVDPRNPPGVVRENSGMFSRAALTRMFAEFRRHYDALDAGEAEATAKDKGRAGGVAVAPAVKPGGSEGSSVLEGSAVDLDVGCSKAACAAGVVAAPVSPSIGSAAGQAALSTTPAAEAGKFGNVAVHDGNTVLGPMNQLPAAGACDVLCKHMVGGLADTFVSGGPRAGKTTFLKRFSGRLLRRFADEGQVVVCAPTGSAAKTAGGSTYHSFFGFLLRYQPENQDAAVEAARLLATNTFKPTRTRLSRVRVVLLYEISMVPADRFDVMMQLLTQTRAPGDPQCVVYAFGDFLQLRPTEGRFAFEAKCWMPPFRGFFLDLTLVHRQRDGAVITAIRDARFGLFSTALRALIAERTVSDAQYRALEFRVLHLLPMHMDVIAHNSKFLEVLFSGTRPTPFVCEDSVRPDKGRDEETAAPLLRGVSDAAMRAALADCVAPRVVTHCVQARVMYTSNAKHVLGTFHGSIGYLSMYLPDGTAVVRFPDTPLPKDVRLHSMGVRDAGETWIDVECPFVEYEAPLLSCPGAVAVRKQMQLVLDWAITIHRSQSLTLSEAVLDLRTAFVAGMVHAAVSRVSDRERLYI